MLLLSFVGLDFEVGGSPHKSQMEDLKSKFIVFRLQGLKDNVAHLSVIIAWPSSGCKN